MFAMISKEFRELRRDRRTVAMLVALPVLLVIFGYAANLTVSSLDTDVIGPGAATAHLPPMFGVSARCPAASSEQARTLLRDGTAAVVIDTTTRPTTAWIDGSSLLAAMGTLARSGQPVTVRVLSTRN